MTMTPSRIIAICSTKGGVGKTIVAANLAAAFSRHVNRKTALLEVENATVDAAGLLGNAEVYLASRDLATTRLPELLAELRKTYEYILLDLGTALTAQSVSALEQANLILLVVTPDQVSIRHTNRLIDVLKSADFPLRMIKAILNRAESRGHVRSSQVREAVMADVIAEIPSDGRTVGQSVNQGIPFVLSPEPTRIAEAIKRLAEFLLAHQEIFAEQFHIDRTKIPMVRPEAWGAQETDGEAITQEAVDPIIALKQAVLSQLVERIDLKRLDLQMLVDPKKIKQLREKIEQVVLELIVSEKGFVPESEERKRLVKEIVDEAVGLGPLEDLMTDPEISDILVNGAETIYIEKRGKLSLTDKRFVSNNQILSVVERIISPLGRRLDESTPMVDARLPDGSRVNAIIPPLSIKGPIVSIRRFGRERLTMENLLRLDTLDEPMAAFLTACVLGRLNILISGGTGSGKTTLLNVLSAFIPEDERIITIEDAAELKLTQAHWVALEARMPNVEGKGEIAIRQLFRNALRMRPDRIIIGECRGDETLDMLQAMNTGHDGSLTTVHANSPQDVISRLDSLVLMSDVDLPVRAIREQIASAIHLIVHTARLADGSRKITHITEIAGMDEHEDIRFGEIFLFRTQGVSQEGKVLGEFVTTGYRPRCLAKLQAEGFAVDETIFQPHAHTLKAQS